MSESDCVLLSCDDGIATITLNRPLQHNALSRELRTRFTKILNFLADNASTKIIIITGSGTKAFSVGADLKEFEQSPLTADEVGYDCGIMQAFAKLNKPTIAAVNGFAVTGGFEIAVNCDIIVGSTNAKFSDTHARVGIVPALGLSQLLPLIVGPVRAKYLSFTGNYIDAQTAKSWGLLLDVVEPNELLPYCLRLANEIKSCDTPILYDVKKAINAGLINGIAEGFKVEASLAKTSTKTLDMASFSERTRNLFDRGKSQQ